jgi:hypothetical protein
MGLDADMRQYGDRGLGQFNALAKNKLMEIRRTLDAYIKALPEYSAKMEEVAALRQLQEDASTLFGTRQSTFSKIRNIQKPENANALDTIIRLEQAAGGNFKAPLEDFIQTMRVAKDPSALEKMVTALPEYEVAQRARLDFERVKSQPYQDGLKQAVEQGAAAEKLKMAQAALDEATAKAKAMVGEAEGALKSEKILNPEGLGKVQQGQMNAEQALMKNQAALEAAQSTLDPVKQVTPATSENFVKSLMGDPTTKSFARDTLAKLSQLGDQDFATMINQARTVSAFEKGSMNGSRNVNFWSIMGAIFGGLTMHSVEGAGALAAIGNAFGRAMDIHGPATTRKILDGVIKIKGLPTIEKIEAALQAVPESVRNDLKRQLVRALTTNASGQPISVSQSDVAQMQYDIKNSKNLNSVEKAKALNDLAKGRTLAGNHAKKLMIGAQVEPMPIMPQQAQDTEEQNFDFSDDSDFVNTMKSDDF